MMDDGLDFCPYNILELFSTLLPFFIIEDEDEED